MVFVWRYLPPSQLVPKTFVGLCDNTEEWRQTGAKLLLAFEICPMSRVHQRTWINIDEEGNSALPALIEPDGPGKVRERFQL